MPGHLSPLSSGQCLFLGVSPTSFGGDYDGTGDIVCDRIH